MNRAAPIALGQPSEALRPLVNYVIACAGADGLAVVPGELDRVEQVGECVVYRRPGELTCGSLAPFEHSWRW